MQVMPKKMRSACHTNAVTLLEILGVVIGISLLIIASLSAILQPDYVTHTPPIFLGCVALSLMGCLAFIAVDIVVSATRTDDIEH